MTKRCPAPAWRFNHAPIPRLQSKNCDWWKNKAERHTFTSGSGATLGTKSGILSSRNSILKAVQGRLTSSVLVCLSGEISTSIYSGINEDLSKKRKITDFEFSGFQSGLAFNESGVPFARCDDDSGLNQKRKLAFTASKDGINYRGKVLTPFSVYSSSILSTDKGYKAFTNEFMPSWVDITNIHEDAPFPIQHDVSLQGPFTSEHVGGLKSRHAWIFSQNDRPEAFRLILTSSSPYRVEGIGPRPTNWSSSYDDYSYGQVSTPQGKYARGLGAKRPVNITNLKSYTGSYSQADGRRPIGNFTNNYEVVSSTGRKTANIDFVFNNPNYQIFELAGATAASAFVVPPSYRGVTPGGVQVDPRLSSTKAGLTSSWNGGSVDYAAPREISTRRTTKSVITSRFASPGGKYTSKQQFRDISSDELSPNNALPWRNYKLLYSHAGLRQIFRGYTFWGGFISFPYLYLNLNGPQALQNLNDGVDINVAFGGQSNWSTMILNGSGDAKPVEKTQRNGLERIETAIDYSVWPFVLGPVTGTAYDNGYVTTPIPRADRTEWFMNFAAGGWNPYSDYFPGNSVTVTPTHVYDQYVLSGSRYPQNISRMSSSLVSLPNQAVATIVPTSGLEAKWDAIYIKLTDTSGNQCTFTGTASIPIGSPPSQTAAGSWEYGVGFMTTVSEWGSSFSEAILSALYAGDIDISAVDNTWSGLGVSLYQGMAGSEGNTELQENFPSPTSPATYTDFEDGRSAVNYNFGSALVSGTSGKNKFVWSDQYGFVPWQQLRAGQNAQGAYLRKNNIYEFPPSLEITSYDRNSVALEGKYHASAGTRTASDRAGRAGTTSGSSANILTYSLGARFIEPPLTSKFKPMRANLKTNLGSPSSTRYGQKVPAKMEFSYGNMLCGFANKRLNQATGNPYKFSYNKIKRPYEIMRNHRLDGVLPSSDGIQRINMLTYSETIYPKEVYTYLSGTRSRLSFVDNFWKSDISVYHNSNAADLVATGDFGLSVSQYNQSSNIAGWNRQFNRVQKPSTRAGNRIFQTSQGYEIQVSESVPSDVAYATSEPANASIWPLDSYLYSDYLPAWTGSAGNRLLLADVATMAAGELMMTNYGTIIDQSSYGLGAGATYEPSSIVAAQYVYSVPTEVQNSVSLKMEATALAPGGATTRPPWTAGKDRKIIDGPSRGTSLPPKEPSYDTYEKYAESVRLSGKENTIIPEYIMSNWVSTYRTSGDPLSYVPNSVELTGANTQNYNGSNTDFFTRYSDSDTIEYLKQFMSGRDLEFNKYPKHFQLTSNATLKLLPYNGFFPMNRTLQIATLFSSSYSSNAIYAGDDSTKGPWRSILKPFFAPGILYNSIKSGVAVNHPVRRGPWGGAQFAATEAPQPLKGALSGNLGTSGGDYVSVPGGRRRPRTPSAGNFDFTIDNVDKFFWTDRLPFEAILDPEPHISSTSLRDFLIISDIRNVTKNDISGSISGQVEDSLYKKAISNFLASVPEFFLKKKPTANHSSGYLTKFVSQFGPNDSDDVNHKLVSGNKIYMMEVGLMKTDNFNMYNNPYAFGPPTATGSESGGSWNNASYSVGKSTPSGSAWPKHRGEFAPFTPPYYYGPSVARFFYAPNQDKRVSLNDILTSTGQNNPELFVQYRNESGSFYDYSSGSFTSFDGTEVTLSSSPAYEWNRAWQNRMDIDASITLNNSFKIDNGTYTSKNPNRWVIMPKWESPILDFPGPGNSYDFSGSVDTDNSNISLNFNQQTYGMWHQYGMSPTNNEGVYLYIKDHTSLLTEPDYILVGDPNVVTGAPEGYYTYAKKIPWPVQEAINNGKEVGSLADLVGFAPEEVMSSGIDLSKAKRLGELATGGEKSLSEAILALPFYYDEQNRQRLVTLQGSGHDLGPKLRKFRRAFTKYSMPPPLATRLSSLVPTNYPNDDGLINPFADDDDYSNILMNSDPSRVPIVYLFEHQIKLSKQDLADIWQGILPEIGTNMKRNVVAIDHYMPGRATGEDELAYPELLQKEIEEGIQDGSGLPKIDLMDTITEDSGNGFCPQVRWIIFKVKQKGYSNYSALIANEIDGVDNRLLDTIQRHPANPPERQNYFFNNSVSDPTYNWPYDYMSLVETANLQTKIGFRPELAGELADYQIQQEPPRLPQDIRITGVTLPPNADSLMASTSVGTLAENLNNATYVPALDAPSFGQFSTPMVVRNSTANVSMGGFEPENFRYGGASNVSMGPDKPDHFRYGGAANVGMGGWDDPRDWKS